MAIADVLIPALQTAFPDRGLLISSAPNPIVVFPAGCAEVGDVLIYDDGDEATVVIENVTHHHVNPYDTNMSEEERDRWVAEEVIEFLHDLFADQVFLWSIEKGKAGGGWQRGYDGTIPPDVPTKADTFVWSRRLRSSETIVSDKSLGTNPDGFL